MAEQQASREWVAQVRRENGAWTGQLLDQAGHPIDGASTWARSLATLRRHLAEVAVLEADLPEQATARIAATLELRLLGDAAAEVTAARAARAEAATAERTAASSVAQALRALVGVGLSDRDAAELLGMSFQRVAQLRDAAGIGSARSARNSAAARGVDPATASPAGPSAA